jgi:hypothetical protein
LSSALGATRYAVDAALETTQHAALNAALEADCS